MAEMRNMEVADVARDKGEQKALNTNLNPYHYGETSKSQPWGGGLIGMGHCFHNEKKAFFVYNQAGHM